MFSRLDMACAIIIAGCIGYVGGFRSAKERFSALLNDWLLSTLKDKSEKPEPDEQEN